MTLVQPFYQLFIELLACIGIGLKVFGKARKHYVRKARKKKVFRCSKDHKMVLGLIIVDLLVFPRGKINENMNI